ncbi:DUF4019 domain-containing protein [Pseudomonas sp. RIT-PI-AD]|uniref:DUF4019 domain-containing protein n=1 Tax=Pseudomonas sp. RIT-PI-AD TaxID=3035294 RepID=UPI0021D94D23|nr:DUF4019 domain-containing protein [Pseudomonas sp. RIT-PI-AD]
MRKLARLSFIFFLALSVSCSQDKEARERDSERYVSLFQKKFNEKDIAAIYDNASDNLKVGVKKEEFIGSIEKIRETLGENISTKKDKIFYLEDTNGVPLLVVTYNTRFAKGVGVETFMLELEKKRVSLHRYNINSDDLVRSLLLGEKKD